MILLTKLYCQSIIIYVVGFRMLVVQGKDKLQMELDGSISSGIQC